VVDDGVAVRVDVKVERTGIDTLSASVVISQKDGNRLRTVVIN
jgi:hypothetical protein